MTARIPLSGHVGAGQFIRVDDADAEQVTSQSWWLVNTGPGKAYVQGHVAGSGKDGPKIYLHTLLTGWPKVDHADGDPLNNCRDNLREATNGQNQANSAGRGVSSYKGVYWIKARRKWGATITVDRHTRWLGSFIDETAAARAYDAAAREAWGKFAWLNFPEASHAQE